MVYSGVMNIIGLHIIRLVLFVHRVRLLSLLVMGVRCEPRSVLLILCKFHSVGVQTGGTHLRSLGFLRYPVC